MPVLIASCVCTPLRQSCYLLAVWIWVSLGSLLIVYARQMNRLDYELNISMGSSLLEDRMVAIFCFGKIIAHSIILLAALLVGLGAKFEARWLLLPYIVLQLLHTVLDCLASGAVLMLYWDTVYMPFSTSWRGWSIILLLVTTVANIFCLLIAISYFSQLSEGKDIKASTSYRLRLGKSGTVSYDECGPPPPNIGPQVQPKILPDSWIPSDIMGDPKDTLKDTRDDVTAALDLSCTVISSGRTGRISDDEFMDHSLRGVRSNLSASITQGSTQSMLSTCKRPVTLNESLRSPNASFVTSNDILPEDKLKEYIVSPVIRDAGSNSWILPKAVIESSNQGNHKI